MLLTLTGGAGAGKTTLAAALAVSAPAGPVAVLHGDDYYHVEPGPGRGVWAPDENGVPRLDVGHPDSVDAARLDADLAAALRRAELVIVEGLFARLAGAGRDRRLDVFVDLPADLRLVRKIDRKCVRGGFPLEVLLRNYLAHRRDAHERYVEPLRAGCALTVDGGRPPAELAARVWAAVAANA
ncbi:MULTISPECIES: hypothetical protein [Kitasatospora]|uniref:Phosphoribulokinase/uridine kinase domain-containing protein n=1 Tax=Kitasatospora setae (strain ATCC 33774 / DSM 43861 / JCM 3304 / KCC A-0304 / NBRC 14216 / KM-6054) TaxID=452652 RepID=E4N953_KITSK|nr:MULTISPECIES: hypothetical protein [Kitasatospora]BAJ27734.1 hypothetical protein KSE_19100 [Kitasatospora setae KM-6054]